MLGATAKRIVHPIREPRNNADEAIAAKPEWDGAGRAICCVAPLANGTYHWLRVASCISSPRASVATTRDLCRGSFASPAVRDRGRLRMDGIAPRIDRQAARGAATLKLQIHVIRPAAALR